MKKPKEERPGKADDSEPVGEHVRIYRRGKTWYETFQRHRKQYRRSLKTTNKKQAIRKALKTEAEIAAGIWQPAVETATVERAVAAYWEKQQGGELAAKTLQKYQTLLERFKAFAAYRQVRDLAGIDLAFVDAYAKSRRDAKRKAKTIYNELSFLRQLINFVISRKMVPNDPLAGWVPKKPKPTEQPCWTLEQVQRILAASPPEIRSAFVLLAETGMRFGELAWLTWADVDLEHNYLHLRPKDGWRLKTGDRRDVPLSATATAAMKGLPRLSRWVVTMPPTRQHPELGRKWTERRLLDALKRVLKQLSLPGKLHTFRHFFISNALLKGTPQVLVRKWVGHVDQRILDLYSHVDKNADQSAMQRLEQANKERQKEQGTNEGKETGPAQISHSSRRSKMRRCKMPEKQASCERVSRISGEEGTLPPALPSRLNSTPV